MLKSRSTSHNEAMNTKYKKNEKDSKMKSLLIKSAIASGVVLSLATLTHPVMASTPFTVSIEAPGAETANYSNLLNYNVENFDNGLTASNSVQNFAWSNVGNYTSGLVQGANQYGGAGGTGNFFDVNSGISGGVTTSTLNLTTPQSYFGLWWSAGDVNNTLSFYSNGQLLETLTTANVESYIAALPNSGAYNGNPSGQYQGQDNGEPFAFINFYDIVGTFNQVVFSNAGGTGFESDNHTVATGYKSITGTVVTAAVPESSSVLGIFVIGFVGAASVMTRQVKKKSVLQLS